MNKLKFLIRITDEKIPCSGKQLLLILKVIQGMYKNFVWYAADVEINGIRPFKLCLESNIPRRIGFTKDLIQITQNVDQFLSGVFFALSESETSKEILNYEFFTEDEPFRQSYEANLEIRAFDTSYFEIYTNDINIIGELSKNFVGQIENNNEKEVL